MKFKSKTFLKSREGEEKIKRVFLWLPTRFGDEPVARWLEMADVVYSINKVDMGDGFWSDYHWVWMKDRFPTDDDYRSLPFEGKSSTNAIDFLFDSLGNENKVLLMLDTLVVLSFMIEVKYGITALLALNILKIAFTWANHITKEKP